MVVGGQKILDGLEIPPDRRHKAHPRVFDERYSVAPTQEIAIVTCAANDLVGQVHERMPVILERTAVKAWLDPQASSEALRGLMAPFPAKGMNGWRVSNGVNRPEQDGPELIQALAE